MEYKEIVSVTGEAGLFQLLSSKSDGAIVRSLDGKSTKFVPSRNHNFTPLESIEVFTTGENVMLADVFKAMQEKESTHFVPDANTDNKTIQAYFKEIFPSLDKGRVYQSDLKKMLKWYPQLKNADLLKFEEEKEEEVEKEEPKESVEKPKKAAKARKENKEEEVLKTKEPKVVAKKENTKKKTAAPKEKPSDTKEKASAQKNKK